MPKGKTAKRLKYSNTAVTHAQNMRKTFMIINIINYEKIT